MIRRPLRSRALGASATWLLALAFAGSILPASVLGQPQAGGSGRSASLAAANDCGATDVSGIAPIGIFTISGRVTNGSGDGIEGVRVRARTTTAQVLITDTWTNPDGDFALTELTDEDFVLSFYDETATYKSGYLGPAGLTVVASAAAPVDAGTNPTGVDVVLPNEPDPLPTISGVILDSDLHPVEGVEVRADSPDFPISGCGFSDEFGHYEMPDVRVGRYVVSVTSQGHPHGFYATAPPNNFVTHFGDATRVTVTADIAGIDITFPTTFTLSGTIRNALGDEVGGIALSACEVVEGGLCSFATSEPDGTYSIGSLVAGSYVIRQDDPTFTYTSGYHVAGSQGVVADRSEAEVIMVAADVADVDLLVVANPRITGSVTDPDVQPLAGIEVTACEWPDEMECIQGLTGTGGVYSFGVDPGTYVLRVADPSGDYPAGYVGSSPELVPSAGLALPVTVGANDEAVDQVAFVAGGRISGTMHKDGSPAFFAGFGVCPTDFDCATGGVSDDNGLFRSAAVLPGTYKLGGDTDEGDRIWYVDGGPPVADFALATEITVGTTEVTGIDFDITWHTTTGEPTPDGDFVSVVPTDPATGNRPVTLTFDHVEIAGETSLTIVNDGPAAPSGFQVGVPPTFFDISTTADFGGSLVTVCISYAGVSFIDESMLRLFHYEDPDWEDTTSSLDTVNDVICGRTDSFSPFAVFERTMAFTGFRSPIQSPPAVNRATAAETIPLGFGLGGDFGASVLAAGSPASQRADCTTGAPIGPIEATTSVDRKDVLRYDRNKQLYVYNWKTIKSWDGTCRQLILTFSNGTTAEAAFDFRPAPKPPKPPQGH